jgi:hypothetical protein
VEKMFHHEHHHKDGKQQEEQEAQSKVPQMVGEMDKFKDYTKEDEKLEQEGRTYGGLM